MAAGRSAQRAEGSRLDGGRLRGVSGECAGQVGRVDTDGMHVAGEVAHDGQRVVQQHLGDTGRLADRQPERVRGVVVSGQRGQRADADPLAQ